MAFVALVATLAVLNVASAFPYPNQYGHNPYPDHYSHNPYPNQCGQKEIVEVFPKKEIVEIVDVKKEVVKEIIEVVPKKEIIKEVIEIVPFVVKTEIPAKIIIGPQAPGIVQHDVAPYEIDYFEKPWIVKNKQSAALNVFSQKPVVVDKFEAPAFTETYAPPTVIVEEVIVKPEVKVVPPPCF